VDEKFFLYWSVLNAEKKIGFFLGSSIGLQSLNFGIHTPWRKARDRDVWHQVVSQYGNAPPWSSPIKKKHQFQFALIRLCLALSTGLENSNDIKLIKL